jgi:hypothetical protein
MVKIMDASPSAILNAIDGQLTKFHLKINRTKTDENIFEFTVERMTLQEVFKTAFDFNSTEEILAYTFTGNHACDHQAFNAINRYLVRNSDDARKIMDHVCTHGMGIDTISDEELAQHLRELRLYAA